MYSIQRVAGLVFMIAVSAMAGWAVEEQEINKTPPDVASEPVHQEKPLSYWLRSIRNRDDQIDDAFDAIIDLGPEAWLAVDELTRIVAEPFMPVRIGVDREDQVGSKLLNIHLRAEAIDALTAIREAAASSTEPLIR